MSFLGFVPVRIAVALAVLGVTLAAAPSAVAHADPDGEHASIEPTGPPLRPSHDETLFENIAAPFACGTEWSGQTRPGHGQNDWNLDFNRTSLNFGEDRQHDLGQPLFAQADGTVTFIGWHVNAGTYMDIDYGDYAARYIHLVDDSVVPELGAAVTQGETIALLGDTGNTPGFAHLHLEYWDSRGFDDARIWELKQAGQPQTEVTFDGNVIDPAEVIVSTNCVGDALNGEAPPAEPPEAFSLIEEAEAVTSATDPVTHLAGRLAALGAESLAGTTDATDFPLGDDVAAVVPGDGVDGEVVLVVVHHRQASACPGEAAPPCPTPFANAVPTAVALGLIERLVADAPERTVLFLFVDDDAGTSLTELIAPTDPIPLLDPLIAAAVGAVHLEALGDAATLRLRNDSVLTGTATFADPTILPDLSDVVGVRWSTLAERPGTNANTAALEALGIPAVGLTDIAGPCRGAAGELADVAIAKANHQLLDAEELVRWFAAGDTELVADVPVRVETIDADLTRFADLLREAAPIETDSQAAVSDVIDGIDTLLATPVADWTDDDLAAAEALLDRFDGIFVDELCSGHASPAPFVDVPTTSFALEDVALLYDLEITVGTTPTTYSPDDPVTREQMAAFLARIWRVFRPVEAAVIRDTPFPFDDVDETSFAFDDIHLLFDLGITTGTSPTTYSPDDPVTREQMAAFLARVWRLLFPDLDPASIDTHPFVDVDETSFAFDDISLIYAIEVTVGTSPTTYSPDDPVTREQMAAFLARVLRRHGAEEVAAPAEPEPE